MKEIKIHGHAATHTLEQIADGIYRCNDTQFIRIIGEIDDVKAIDYDGGPMLSVGTTIKGLGEIEKITSTGLLYIKK